MLLFQLATKELPSSAEKVDPKIKALEKKLGKYQVQGQDIVFSYFSAVLKDYYGEDYGKYSSLKGRVDNFLSWLEKNPGLLEKFKSDEEHGLVEFRDPLFGNRAKSAVNILSAWLGAQYCQSYVLGMPDLKNSGELYKYSVRIKESKKPEGTGFGFFGPNFTHKTTRLNMGDLIVDAINAGIHERTHLIAMDPLDEAGPAIIGEKLALPIKETNFRKATGVRDFYEMYLRLSSSKKKEKQLGNLCNEYYEFAVYPWLKPKISEKDLLNMGHKNVACLADLFDGDARFYDSDFQEKVEIIKMNFGISDKVTLGKLRNVFSKLGVFLQENKDAKRWEYIQKFVELMNAEFGEPDVGDYWRDYSNLVPKKTKEAKKA